jgi:hypothetical protein
LEAFARDRGRDLLGDCSTLDPRAVAEGLHFCYQRPVFGASQVTIEVGGPFSDEGYTLVLQVGPDGSYTLVSATKNGGI